MTIQNYKKTKSFNQTSSAYLFFMHCLLQLHLNHTPNIRSTANYPLLQSMGNDKRHPKI